MRKIELRDNQFAIIIEMAHDNDVTVASAVLESGAEGDIGPVLLIRPRHSAYAPATVQTGETVPARPYFSDKAAMLAAVRDLGRFVSDRWVTFIASHRPAGEGG